MTHAELVERAGKWLRNSMRCGVVFTEFHTWSRLVPDAIGWHGDGWSILVECKTSMSDFYSDRKKAYWGTPRFPGQERWYMAPAGVISPDLIPEGWGLAEVNRSGRRVSKTIPAASKREREYVFESQEEEIVMLRSYVRRVQQYGLSLDEVQQTIRERPRS